MSITLFTRLNCSKCIRVIEELEDRDVDFVLEEINTNLHSKRKFNRYKLKSVPSLVLENPNHTIIIDRVQESNLDTILERAIANAN